MIWMIAAKRPNGLRGVNRPRGVTLMELLVTISIIVVLAALLLPTVSTLKTQAKASKVTSNLRQISAAALSWTADNDGYIIPVYNPSDGGASSSYNWTGQLAPYLGYNKTPASNGNGFFSSAQDLPVAVSPFHPRRFGFGYNYKYLSAPTRVGGTMKRYAAIPSHSQTIMMVTTINASSANEEFSSWRAYVRPPASSPRDHIPVYDMPNNKAAVLWLDGHTSFEPESVIGVDDRLWSGSGGS